MPGKSRRVRALDETGVPGGARRNRLFTAASHSLYSLYVNTQGALGG